VHLFEQCSLPYGDDSEGFGQKRICLQCSKQKNVVEIMESQEMENWGGVSSAKKIPPVKLRSKKKAKRTIYLEKNYAPNEFLVQKPFKSIPILRNGDDKSLKQVKIAGKHIDFLNTCAFDSLLQILLTAAIDHEKFFNRVKNLAMPENIFSLIESLAEKGVTQSAYKWRGKILMGIFETRGQEQLNCLVVSCDTTISDLAKQLLQQSSGLIEEHHCENGCEIQQVFLPTLSVTPTAQFSNTTVIENEIFINPERKCTKKGCHGVTQIKFKISGNK